MTASGTRDRKPRGTPTAIALFGGVFDPIHIAHLAVARAALGALPVSEIRFLPAGDPPHKSAEAPVAGPHRRAMIERAIAGEPRFRCDSREIDRSGASYTILTLEEIAAELPGAKIYFLIGADNARSIGTWHRAKEIFDACDPVVVARPGEPVELTAEDVPFLDEPERERLNALAIEGVSLEHSSSEVRRRVRQGLSIEGWVPAEVATYIEENGLYRGK